MRHLVLGGDECGTALDSTDAEGPIVVTGWADHGCLVGRGVIVTLGDRYPECHRAALPR